MYNPAVSFVIPFRIYLPENFYEVKIGSREFKVKPQRLPPLKTAQDIEVLGNNVEFLHDIFGYAGRTLFYVLLDYQVDMSTEEDKGNFVKRDKLFINDAVVVINRLLEVYRDQDKNSLGEKSFHITPIVLADISDIRIVLVKDNAEVQGISVRIPSLRPISFGVATQRSAEVISEITELLRGGTKIPIYREILSSSMNTIWRGLYRLSPVESNTAFEAFISEITLLLDSSTVLPENLFGKLVLLESVLNRKFASKSLAVISWFTPEKNGWKSILDPVLISWKDKCYELRGKIIHEGYSQVTLREAVDSHETSLGAINYIQGLVQRIIDK